MKFRLFSRQKIFHQKANKHEIISLEKIGFVFSPSNIEDTIEIINNGKVIIEINSIEELIQFQEKVGWELLLDNDTLEIYNYFEDNDE